MHGRFAAPASKVAPARSEWRQLHIRRCDRQLARSPRAARVRLACSGAPAVVTLATPLHFEAVPLVVASATDGLLPWFGHHPPLLGTTSLAFLAATIAWGLLRQGHSLFVQGDFATSGRLAAAEAT